MRSKPISNGSPLTGFGLIVLAFRRYLLVLLLKPDWRRDDFIPIDLVDLYEVPVV